jgi:photosystem II PsbY protein
MYKNKNSLKYFKKSERKTKNMDWRLLIVLLPLIVAASWAFINIGAAALSQAQRFLDKPN